MFSGLHLTEIHFYPRDSVQRVQVIGANSQRFRQGFVSIDKQLQIVFLNTEISKQIGIVGHPIARPEQQP